MPNEKVTFTTTRDDDGVMARWVTRHEDGRLSIEGQDLGPGVERWFGPGNREYEFSRTLSADAVRELQRQLDMIDGPDFLQQLRARFESTHELEKFVAEHGIESEFWSRVGD